MCVWNSSAHARTFTQTPSNSLRMSVNYEHNMTFHYYYCYCYLYVSCARVFVLFLYDWNQHSHSFVNRVGRLYYLSVSIIRFYFIWFDDYFCSIELVCILPLLWLLIAIWPLSPQAKYQMKLAYTHRWGPSICIEYNDQRCRRTNEKSDGAKCVHYLFASCTLRLWMKRKEIPLWALSK